MGSEGEFVMMRLLLPIVLASLAVSAPAGPAMADQAQSEGTRNCVPTRRLKNTAVIDDKNILFVMIGDKIYHNELPRQCSGLAQSGSFTYGTMVGNVCRQDTIQVLRPNSDLPGRTCSLGVFRPVAPEDLRALVEGLRGPVSQGKAPPPADVEEIGEAEGGAESNDEGAPR